jgi:hypothetical protein
MERWQQIESLFQEALERDPAERNAWLREACQGDSDLRREVASLLANHQEATDSKPFSAAAAELIADRVSLQPGQSLGRRYRFPTEQSAWPHGTNKGCPKNHCGHGVPQQVLIDELTTAGFRVHVIPTDWPGRSYCVVLRRLVRK